MSKVKVLFRVFQINDVSKATSEMPSCCRCGELIFYSGRCILLWAAENVNPSSSGFVNINTFIFCVDVLEEYEAIGDEEVDHAWLILNNT